jgi:hypothetical protein
MVMVMVGFVPMVVGDERDGFVVETKPAMRRWNWKVEVGERVEDEDI